MSNVLCCLCGQVRSAYSLCDAGWLCFPCERELDLDDGPPEPDYPDHPEPRKPNP